MQFGRAERMDRGGGGSEKDGGEASLLGKDDEDDGGYDERKGGDGGGSAQSLADTAKVALQDAKVREMLAAFRAEGPSALARYVHDPACSASLDVLRGTAEALPKPPMPVGPVAPTAVPAELNLSLPTATATSVTLANGGLDAFGGAGGGGPTATATLTPTSVDHSQIIEIIGADGGVMRSAAVGVGGAPGDLVQQQQNQSGGACYCYCPLDQAIGKCKHAANASDCEGMAVAEAADIRDYCPNASVSAHPTKCL